MSLQHFHPLSQQLHRPRTRIPHGSASAKTQFFEHYGNVAAGNSSAATNAAEDTTSLSLSHEAARRTHWVSTRSWHGTAFVIEALLLLLFLAASLAIVMQLFGTSYTQGVQNQKAAEAIQVATNVAEEFAAQPARKSFSQTEGDYAVSCVVVPKEYDGGTLYEATITVYEGFAETDANTSIADGVATDAATNEGATAGSDVDATATATTTADTAASEPLYELQTAAYVSTAGNAGALAGESSAADSSGVKRHG